MTNKLTKYGFMIIAAVLLVGLVFAGAASAKTTYNATEWNALEDVSALSGTIRIVDTAKTASIEPKYLGTEMLTLSNDLTLDFSGYKGTFEGVPAGTDANLGALFGNVTIESGKKLEIIGLKMKRVNVTSTEGYIGGIIGGVSSGSGAGNAVLTLTDCHLENCSITVTGEGMDKDKNVGGMAGAVEDIVLNVDRCSVIHCDVLADKWNVGGLIGYATDGMFSDCLVANSTVAATVFFKGENAGGLIGAAYSANFTRCTLRTTSVYEAGYLPYCSGGLAGNIADASNTSIVSCEVENSVIATASYGGKAGGLIGYVGYVNGNYSLGNIASSRVINSTIVGTSPIGGLFANVNYVATSSANSYKNIAVRGSGDYISGGGPLSIDCTPEGTNFLDYYTLMSDNITLYTIDGTEISTLPDAGFWKNISYTTGEKYAGPATIVTNLGQYGTPSGYGVTAYVPYTVTVTYDDRRGDAYADADEYEAGETVTLTAIPYKGYTFKKWTASGIRAASIVNNQFTMPANDVTVTAIFGSADSYYESKEMGSTVILKNTAYKVNFTMNGHGVQVTNQTVAVGSTATEPYPAPTADGFVFNGWYSNKNLTTKYVFSTPVISNIELYANWTDIAIQPVTIPTKTPKSPVPFIGLIAGLGAAAVLLRLRK